MERSNREIEEKIAEFGVSSSSGEPREGARPRNVRG
jgi:hypothetical protein